MRYEPLPSSFYSGNRKELASRLPVGSMLILHANDVFPTNADGTFALHQNANLFYLTGIDQEESVLIMTIRADGWDEILLLRETNEQIAIWEGARLSQQQARELSGIQDVRWTKEYDSPAGPPGADRRNGFCGGQPASPLHLPGGNAQCPHDQGAEGKIPGRGFEKRL